MGNNAAFTAFERAVIGAYDRDVLTLSYLDEIAEPYRDTDIDMGGSEDRETKDGKDIIEVVVELVMPEWKPREEDLLPEDIEREGEGWESFARYLKWDEIRQTRWGWW